MVGRAGAKAAMVGVPRMRLLATGGHWRPGFLDAPSSRPRALRALCATQVEFDEFMSIMASNMVRDGGSELEQAFTLFDPQRTGFVDLEVARKLLTSTGQRPLTNAEVDDMIAHMGADSNGRIPMARLEGLSAWQSPLAGADGKVLSSVVSDTGEAAAPAAAANPGRIESPHGG